MMKPISQFFLGIAFVAATMAALSTSAYAVAWQKWDSNTWIDSDSIHVENGLTYYHLLMLDHVVDYPSGYTDGNEDGRYNCATGDSWTYEQADEDDDGEPTGPFSYVSKGNEKNTGLFKRICARPAGS